MRILLILLLSIPFVGKAASTTPLRFYLDRTANQLKHLPAAPSYYSRTGLLAFSLYDPNYCSEQLAYRLIVSKKPPAVIDGKQIPARLLPLDSSYTYQDIDNKRHVMKLGEQLGNILQNYNRVLTRFIQNGDSVPTENHICVGFMDAHEANAKSDLEGFILIDPRLYGYLAQFRSNAISQMMLELHEMAHQIQYWYKRHLSWDKTGQKLVLDDLIGRFLKNDATVKRFELTADCMSAVMSGMLLPTNSDFVMDSLQMGGFAYGDFAEQNKTHHGTPLLRSRAVNQGIAMLKKVRQSDPELKHFTTGQLLDGCENIVSDLQTVGEMLKPH